MAQPEELPIKCIFCSERFQSRDISDHLETFHNISTFQFNSVVPITAANCRPSGRSAGRRPAVNTVKPPGRPNRTPIRLRKISKHQFPPDQTVACQVFQPSNCPEARTRDIAPPEPASELTAATETGAETSESLQEGQQAIIAPEPAKTSDRHAEVEPVAKHKTIHNSGPYCKTTVKRILTAPVLARQSRHVQSRGGPALPAAPHTLGLPGCVLRYRCSVCAHRGSLGSALAHCRVAHAEAGPVRQEMRVLLPSLLTSELGDVGPMAPSPTSTTDLEDQCRHKILAVPNSAQANANLVQDYSTKASIIITTSEGLMENNVESSNSLVVNPDERMCPEPSSSPINSLRFRCPLCPLSHVSREEVREHIVEQYSEREDFASLVPVRQILGVCLERTRIPTAFTAETPLHSPSPSWSSTNSSLQTSNIPSQLSPPLSSSFTPERAPQRKRKLREILALEDKLSQNFCPKTKSRRARCPKRAGKSSKHKEQEEKRCENLADKPDFSECGSAQRDGTQGRALNVRADLKQIEQECQAASVSEETPQETGRQENFLSIEILNEIVHGSSSNSTAYTPEETVVEEFNEIVLEQVEENNRSYRKNLTEPEEKELNHFLDAAETNNFQETVSAQQKTTALSAMKNMQENSEIKVEVIECLESVERSGESAAGSAPDEERTSQVAGPSRPCQCMFCPSKFDTAAELTVHLSVCRRRVRGTDYMYDSDSTSTTTELTDPEPASLPAPPVEWAATPAIKTDNMADIKSSVTNVYKRFVESYYSSYKRRFPTLGSAELQHKLREGYRILRAGNHSSVVRLQQELEKERKAQKILSIVRSLEEDGCANFK